MKRSKIRVYLQYPWKFPDSPYYKYLVENLPKGIEYLNAEKQRGVIINERFFWFSNFLKRNIRRFSNLTRLSIPNAHLSPTEDYDLIHCAHCLSKNKNKPWVADFESEWQLYLGKKTNRAKKRIRKILMNNNCKKILAWTEETKRKIIKEFPEIKNKVGVVYPAVPIQRFRKKRNKKITILYTTRYFWLKGGLVALEVCKKLKEEYQDKIELIFVSDVPEEIKKRYSEIEIKNIVPQKELFEYYKKADIFFYPSFVDTFGFGLLEAMSFSLPIVTVNTKYTTTRKDVIENNKQGFTFNIEDDVNERIIKDKENLIVRNEEKEIIDKLTRSISILIENKKLREKMGSNSFKLVESGKFSIKGRNKELKRIYEEAIK